MATTLRAGRCQTCGVRVADDRHFCPTCLEAGWLKTFGRLPGILGWPEPDTDFVIPQGELNWRLFAEGASIEQLRTVIALLKALDGEGSDG